MEQMANAAAEGARQAGGEAVVKRVPELVPEEIARNAHFKLDHPAATQHGGQETTLFSGITNLMHFGMIIVGLPYAYQGQMTLDEIVGGSPYGAPTIAG